MLSMRESLRGLVFYLVDKVCKRLDAWKNKSLSLAGRLTLIKLVTSALFIYMIQIVKLPVSICEKLHKANRDSLWGDNGSSSKTHLVDWDTVCLSKMNGGLRLRKAKEMNHVLLAKPVWNLLTSLDSLWAEIFICKYLKGKSLRDCETKRGDLATWRAIMYGAGLVKSNVRWNVVDGNHIYFWKDKWTNLGPLIPWAIKPISEDAMAS